MSLENGQTMGDYVHNPVPSDNVEDVLDQRMDVIDDGLVTDVTNPITGETQDY